MTVLTPHEIRDVDSLRIHRQEDLARKDVHILQVECHLNSAQSVKQDMKKRVFDYFKR